MRSDASGAALRKCEQPVGERALERAERGAMDSVDDRGNARPRSRQPAQDARFAAVRVDDMAGFRRSHKVRFRKAKSHARGERGGRALEGPSAAPGQSANNFELHDMWPLSPMLIANYSKYHPFIWIMQRAENYACKKSNCYISLLGNAKDYLIQHGLQKNKFFHIPNGFSNDELEKSVTALPEEYEGLLKKLRTESKCIIGYAGNHTPSDALKSFVSASRFFAEDSGISFVFVGDGSQKQELIEIVRANNQKNIYFLPRVSKSLIPVILSKFDILYAGGIKSILHGFGTSFNKIIDYMIAEKPIIFAVDEPNSLIEKIGCGLQIPAENETELIKTIKFFTELTSEERTVMGKKGREYALKELNYTHLAKRFIEAIVQS